ncbi:CFF_collapsed_G0054390.mRNA.1.CDS.1 [Saccharomyces cerevisiae]|nr:CFF_collapsed_G0054390.mRNA.1.CDS.1 [Saccharomyces cerevisiae]
MKQVIQFCAPCLGERDSDSAFSFHDFENHIEQYTLGHTLGVLGLIDRGGLRDSGFSSTRPDNIGGDTVG